MEIINYNPSFCRALWIHLIFVLNVPFYFFLNNFSIFFRKILAGLLFKGQVG